MLCTNILKHLETCVFANLLVPIVVSFLFCNFKRVRFGFVDSMCVIAYPVLSNGCPHPILFDLRFDAPPPQLPHLIYNWSNFVHIVINIAPIIYLGLFGPTVLVAVFVLVSRGSDSGSMDDGCGVWYSCTVGCPVLGDTSPRPCSVNIFKLPTRPNATSVYADAQFGCTNVCSVCTSANVACTNVKLVRTNAESVCTIGEHVCTNAASVCTDAKLVCTNAETVCTNGTSVCTNTSSICKNVKFVCSNARCVYATRTLFVQIQDLFVQIEICLYK